MKRFLTLILIFLAVLAGCSGLGGPREGKELRQIGRALDLDLSGGTLVRFEDSHGGFHGDGKTVAEVALDSLVEELEGAPGWRPLPMTDSAARAVRLCGEGGAPVDMMDLACRYITSQPEGKRLDAICRMLFQATQTMMPSGFFSEPVKFPSRCTLPDEVAGPGLLMRSGAKLEEGLLFGTVSEEFSFMTVSPEPENGWAAYFAQNDDYRKLFAALARPNCLELLEFLYSEKEHYIVAEAAAARLGLPEEEVAALFREMCGIHLLHRLEMELASGMIDTYIINENFALIPFLLTGRCLIEKDMAFYVQWITRKRPLLRKPGEEKKKEKNG